MIEEGWTAKDQTGTDQIEKDLTDLLLSEVAEEAVQKEEIEDGSHPQEATTTSTSGEEAETCTMVLPQENMVMAADQATDTKDLLPTEAKATKNTSMITMDKELTCITDHPDSSKVPLQECADLPQVVIPENK